MALTVKNIDSRDEQRMITQLQDAGMDEIVSYIKALRTLIDVQEDLIQKAKAKIRELSQ